MNNEFLIPVSGLALGSHSYQFEINDDFFAEREYSEVQQGNVSVTLDVDRQETMLSLRFDIRGEVRIPCDRCAEEFDMPIKEERSFFIKLGNGDAEESEEVAVVPAEQPHYDVSSLIYEYIILAVPMHRVHPEGGCNPDVLALLNTPVADEGEKTIDPRWAALKDIQIENNQTTDK